MLSEQMKQAVGIVWLVSMVTVASPVAAQEGGDLFRCSSFVEDWTATQRASYVAGLSQGYAAAVAYSDGVYNDADGAFLDEWETNMVESDSLDTESFIVGLMAMKETVRDLVEPALERPGRELLDRLMILCRRPGNRDKYVGNFMHEALQEMQP